MERSFALNYIKNKLNNFKQNIVTVTWQAMDYGWNLFGMGESGDQCIQEAL
jgi:hypothetical protein